MNNIARIIIYVCCSGAIILSGWVCYHIGYDSGYEKGRGEVPMNVLEISGISITKNAGLYEFTVTSGNKTFNIAEIPSK